MKSVNNCWVSDDTFFFYIKLFLIFLGEQRNQLWGQLNTSKFLQSLDSKSSISTKKISPWRNLLKWLRAVSSDTFIVQSLCQRSSIYNYLGHATTLISMDFKIFRILQEHYKGNLFQHENNAMLLDVLYQRTGDKNGNLLSALTKSTCLRTMWMCGLIQKSSCKTWKLLQTPTGAESIPRGEKRHLKLIFHVTHY